MTPEQIGKALRDAREKRGWSAREVAKRAGCSPSHIGNIEAGRNVTDDAVQAVARIYGLELGVSRLLLPRGAVVRPVTMPTTTADAVEALLGVTGERLAVAMRILSALPLLEDEHLRIVAMQLDAMSAVATSREAALRR